MVISTCRRNPKARHCASLPSSEVHLHGTAAAELDLAFLLVTHTAITDGHCLHKQAVHPSSAVSLRTRTTHVTKEKRRKSNLGTFSVATHCRLGQDGLGCIMVVFGEHVGGMYRAVLLCRIVRLPVVECCTCCHRRASPVVVVLHPSSSLSPRPSLSCDWNSARLGRIHPKPPWLNRTAHAW